MIHCKSEPPGTFVHK